ncbi:MAG TPA: hypothetical protein VFR81_27155 [Longimicrobium sp.]|nr:hypothetical protein [Longimicrobium sp.]
MNLKAMLLAGAVAAAGFLALPGEASGCSTCSLESPSCTPANYSRCRVWRNPDQTFTCTTQYEYCAWVQNVSDLSADGSLAVWTVEGEAPAATLAAGEATRGCHGLIVDRDYSSRRVAEVRAETATLRI